MGVQVLKQPNGEYAIFSSSDDYFIMWNATEEDVLNYFIERETEATKIWVERLMEKIRSGNPRKAYYQFAITWEEALKLDSEHGGNVKSLWGA